MDQRISQLQQQQNPLPSDEIAIERSGNTEAQKISLQQLAEVFRTVVAAAGSGFIPVNGTLLPNVSSTDAGYALVGINTFTQENGANIVTTLPLNILGWNGTKWSLVKEIPINADLSAVVTKAEFSAIRQAVKIKDGSSSAQLSNNALLINKLIGNDGAIPLATTLNAVSTPYQAIPSSSLITLSGLGAVTTALNRYVIKNASGAVIASALGLGGSNKTNVAFTSPAEAGLTIAVNVSSESGAGTALVNGSSPYPSSFMMNVGPALPYADYGVSKLIDKSSIDFNFDGVASAASVLSNTSSISGINNKLGPLFKPSEQLSDNLSSIQSGSWNVTGAYSASNNTLSLKKQVLSSLTEKTLSGFPGIATSYARVLFWDSNNNLISIIQALGTVSSAAVKFTPPENAYYWAANIATGTNVGLNPTTSQYVNSLMLNNGSAVLPYQPFGSVFNPDGAKKATTLYISPVGSDSNDGLSPDKPLATFTKAKALADNSSELICMGGDYINPDFDPSLFKVLKANRGDRVRFLYGTRLTSAALTLGYTKVYQANYAGAISSTDYLWQHDIEDEATVIQMTERHPLHRGRRTRLSNTRIYPAASIQEIENTTDRLMYYLSGGVLYFSKVANSDLATNCIIIPSKTVLRASKQSTVFISNIQLLYRPIYTEGLSGMFSNMTFGYVNQSGAVMYDNTIDLTFQRCDAFASSNDGFNGHSILGSNLFPYTNRCEVYFRYNLISDCSDDANSWHEYCLAYILGCYAEYNGNGFTPASGAHGICDVSMTRKHGAHPWTTDQYGSGFSAQGASVDGGTGTNLVCNNCVSIDDNRSFSAIDVSSQWINCVSKGAKIQAYAGGQQINCTTS